MKTNIATSHRLSIRRPMDRTADGEYRRPCIIIHPGSKSEKDCKFDTCPVGPFVTISSPEIPVKFISESPLVCRIELPDGHIVIIDTDEGITDVNEPAPDDMLVFHNKDCDQTCWAKKPKLFSEGKSHIVTFGDDSVV